MNADKFFFTPSLVSIRIPLLPICIDWLLVDKSEPKFLLMILLFISANVRYHYYMSDTIYRAREIEPYQDAESQPIEVFRQLPHAIGSLRSAFDQLYGSLKKQGRMSPALERELESLDQEVLKLGAWSRTLAEQSELFENLFRSRTAGISIIQSLVDIPRTAKENEVYESFLEQVQRYVGAKEGLILKLEEDAGIQEVKVAASFGFDEAQTDKKTSGFSMTVALRALESGKLISSRTDQYGSLHPQRSQDLYNIKNYLAVPFKARGQAKAVVYVQCTDLIREFSQSEEEFLQALAALVESILTERKQKVQPSSGQPRSQTVTFSLLEQSQPGLRIEIEKARNAAALDVPVLITGESGTGKGNIAQALHNESQRWLGPLVRVNCYSLSEDQCVSAFYGGAKQAPTSNQPPNGYFESAYGGSLLLTEVGALPIAAQQFLAKYFDDYPLTNSSESQERAFDFRLICTSSEDLAELTTANKILPEFAHVIRSGVELSIPPLRYRPSDIKPLGQEMLRQISQKTSSPLKQLTDDAWIQLAKLPLPGNNHSLARLLAELVTSTEGILISQEDVVAVDPDALKQTDKERWELLLDRFKAAVLRREIEALRDPGSGRWKQTDLAKALGVSAATVTRLLREFSLTDL